MKKNTLIKLIVLSLTLIVGASVLTGCTFSYDEDTDMSQVILEINPVTLSYEVPVYEDYTDPDGKTVYAAYDYDRTSPDFGKKLATAAPVRAVRRTTAGDPVRVAKTEGGDVLYIGYEHLGESDIGKQIEVKANDAKALKDRVSDENFVSPATEITEGGKVTGYNGGVEYKYLGNVTKGNGKAARWQRVTDGEEFFGELRTLSAGDADVTGAYKNDGKFLAELPAIHYDFDKDTYYWEKLTPVTLTREYTSEKEEFFKVTLNNYFAQYAPKMIQEEGKTVDEVFDEFIKNFYLSYLTGVEADLAILSGDAEWGLTEVNTINKTIYDGIDKALDGIFKEIADDFGQTYPEASDKTDGESTYPTPGDETKEDAYDKDYEFWYIGNYPERLIGNDPNPTRVSIERAGVRRFVKVIEDTIEDDLAISEADRAHYKNEIAKMNDAIKGDNKSNIDKLYTDLWTYDVIYYMYGESQAYTLKTQAYRNFLGKSISTENEYVTAYNEKLASQRESFRTSIDSYYTAAKNNETILYFADSEYFWVKHILIPFSDDETARLTEYKKTHSDAAVLEYRRQLGENVTVYKHKDGEADDSESYTIAEAFSEINARMKRAYGDAFACERTFDELIYEYNTDPGIFPGKGSALGYAVTATPAKEGGADETYMIEFADEARALLNAYKNDQSLYDYKSESDKYEPTAFDAKYMKNTEVEIGSISAPILTDYGWHIMYLSVVPTAGRTMGYDSWLTPGRYTRVYEAVGGSTFDTRLNNAYSSWQESLAVKYEEMKDANGKAIIVPHKERFQGKLDEYAENYYGAKDEEEEGGSTTGGATA